MQRLSVSHYVGRKLKTFEQNVTTISTQQNKIKIKWVFPLSRVEFPSRLHIQNLGQVGTSVAFLLQFGIRRLCGFLKFVDFRIQI